MAKKVVNTEQRNDKFSVTFEDEHSVSIWTYDRKKSTSGPIEVEHKFKKTYDKPTKKGQV